MRQYGWPIITAALALMGLLSPCHLAPAAEPASTPDPRPVPRVPLVGPAVSTVDDFNGFVGVIGGHGTGTDGHGNSLDWNADLSFMQGEYVARDGVVRTGTFAFIWLDVFSGSGPTRTQIHDYHIQSLIPPTVAVTDPTYGPFWTVQIPDDSISVTPFGSMVTLDLWALPVSDSFQAFGPMNVPATITVHLQWQPGAKAQSFSDPTQGYAGIYLPATVRLDWSASGPASATDATSFSFQSSPQGQQIDSAAVGHEVDGSLGRS
jgi:hypothetical protein